jgi:LysM repeat protein
LVAVALVAPLFPDQVRAFWPFSNAGASTPPPISNPSTPALEASTNLDPNPNKGLGDIQSSGSALLAYGGPSGTMADVVGSTPPGKISVYVVRPGDTLSIIAEMHGVSINTILWANNLPNAKSVRPGDTLIILPVNGVDHTVVKGDTIKSIAKKYGGEVEEILQFNGLESESSLTVGSTLIIPGGEVEAPPAPVVVKSSPKSNPLLGAGGTVKLGYFINPVPGAIITQGLHGWNGIDIGAPRGTPVYAAAGGSVIIARAGGWNGGYGNYVVITHGNGTQTLYSHLSSVSVSPGQSVSAGETVGAVGNTGKSSGPHLHFEVRGGANPLRNCPVGSVCKAR